MIETYEFVLILIVYTAILLLVIFYVYPLLKKLSKRNFSISIQFGTESKEVKEKGILPKIEEGFPSILGKTKFVLSQPLPNAATDFETEDRKEKEDTFDPETKNQKDENVNYETGEGVEVPPETTFDGTECSQNEDASDVDLNEEEEGLGVRNMPEEVAGGIDYNELGKTAKVVSSPDNSTRADEDLAGKVLSENKYTGLVKSMQDARPEYAVRIKELIDRHERKFAESQNQEVRASKKKQKLYESEDFKNFNIDEIS